VVDLRWLLVLADTADELDGSPLAVELLGELELPGREVELPATLEFELCGILELEAVELDLTDPELEFGTVAVVLPATELEVELPAYDVDSTPALDMNAAELMLPGVLELASTELDPSDKLGLLAAIELEPADAELELEPAGV